MDSRDVENELRGKLDELIQKKKETDDELSNQQREIEQFKNQNESLKSRLDGLENLLNQKIDGILQREKAVEVEEALFSKAERGGQGILDQKEVENEKEIQKESEHLYLLLEKNKVLEVNLEELRRITEEERKKLDELERNDKHKHQFLMKEIEKKQSILKQKEKEIEEARQLKSGNNSINLSLNKNSFGVGKTGMRGKASSKNSALGSFNSWLESDEDSVASSIRNRSHGKKELQNEIHSRLSREKRGTPLNHINEPIIETPNDSQTHITDHDNTQEMDLISPMKINIKSLNYLQAQEQRESQQIRHRKKTDKKLETYKKDPIEEDRYEQAADYIEKYQKIKYYDDYVKQYKANVKKKTDKTGKDYYVKKGSDDEIEEPEFSDEDEEKTKKKRRKKKNKDAWMSCNPNVDYVAPSKKKEEVQVLVSSPENQDEKINLKKDFSLTVLKDDGIVFMKEGGRPFENKPEKSPDREKVEDGKHSEQSSPTYIYKGGEFKKSVQEDYKKNQGYSSSKNEYYDDKRRYDGRGERSDYFERRGGEKRETGRHYEKERGGYRAEKKDDEAYGGNKDRHHWKGNTSRGGWKGTGEGGYMRKSSHRQVEGSEDGYNPKVDPKKEEGFFIKKEETTRNENTKVDSAGRKGDNAGNKLHNYTENEITKTSSYNNHSEKPQQIEDDDIEFNIVLPNQILDSKQSENCANSKRKKKKKNKDEEIDLTLMANIFKR